MTDIDRMDQPGDRSGRTDFEAYFDELNEIQKLSGSNETNGASETNGTNGSHVNGAEGLSGSDEDLLKTPEGKVAMK